MRRRVISRCSCGRVKNRHHHNCNRCYNLQIAAIKAEALSVVELGRCPECRAKLIMVNIGQWRCERSDNCPFQCFT